MENTTYGPTVFVAQEQRSVCFVRLSPVKVSAEDSVFSPQPQRGKLDSMPVKVDPLDVLQWRVLEQAFQVIPH